MLVLAGALHRSDTVENPSRRWGQTGEHVGEKAFGTEPIHQQSNDDGAQDRTGTVHDENAARDLHERDIRIITRVRDAQRVVADLEAHGMKDYYVGKKNHISLGIFSKEDKARVRQQTVQDLGYDALLDQRFRTRPAYWLNVREQGQPLPESEVWQKVLAQHADIPVELMDCE